MRITDLKFVPQGTSVLNIEAFDCGRKSVNDFFHNEAQDYQDEPHLLEFYQRNGLNLFFSSLEQEMEYRNWDIEKDGRLETRLMFRDMILLKRPSIR